MYLGQKSFLYKSKMLDVMNGNFYVTIYCGFYGDFEEVKFK